MLRRAPWMLTKLLRFDLCVHADRLTVHILLIEIHCCWFLVCRILLLLIWLQPTPSGLAWHSTSQCSTMRSWTPLIVLATLQNRFAASSSISLCDLFSVWDMMCPRLYSSTTGWVHRLLLAASTYVGFDLLNKRIVQRKYFTCSWWYMMPLFINCNNSVLN